MKKAEEYPAWDYFKKKQKTDGEKVLLLTLDALTIDGAHHKQWFLEQILQYIMGEEKFEQMKKEVQWEPGIIP